MDEKTAAIGFWRTFKRYYAIPLSLLWIALLAILISHLKRDQPRDYDQTLQGQWNWNDSSIFEFQKITLRFEADSFFMMHRFIDPKIPKARLPCAQPDYQMHTAGKFFLGSNGQLRFEGNYTDHHFSRDTLRLCRDTGFQGLTQVIWKADTLCLGGEAFPNTVCFTRFKPQGKIGPDVRR